MRSCQGHIGSSTEIYWLGAFRVCFRESCLPSLWHENSIPKNLEDWNQRTCCGKESEKMHYSIRSSLKEMTLGRALIGHSKCQPSTLRWLSNFHWKKFHISEAKLFWEGILKWNALKYPFTRVSLITRNYSREDSGNSHIIGSSFDFRPSLLDHADIFPQSNYITVSSSKTRSLGAIQEI